MNILFLHRDYPAQFKYIVLALANDPNHTVTFVTENDYVDIKGVNKVLYKPQKKKSSSNDPCLVLYEDVLCYAKPAAQKIQELKKQGYKPDIIYGFGFWGLNIFVRDIFPDVPLVSYCEWFFNTEGADIGFDGQTFSDTVKSELRCKNSHILVDLYSSDACISPTQWQKQQFPKEFHNKFTVIHDGIDTETCKPDSSAKFLIKDENLELTLNDEVITYGTRGMEPYRGFPQFMEAAEMLLKKRPNAHIVIAGADKNYYGPALSKGTYKKYMLDRLDLDLSRVHFVGGLSFYDFISLLQISSAHVYATFPYILSWSILNAMSVGCCVVASDTAPVQEVMTDNYNGLLYDFYNIDQLVEKVEYALDSKINNKEKIQEIRNNARQTVLDKYDVRKLINLQANFLYSMAKK